MVSLAIFGGHRIDGSMLDPGERVVALALFGGIEFDFVSAPPPAAAEVLIVAVFGGASVKVHAQQAVRMTGLSLFGGRSVEPMRRLPPATPQPEDEDFELPLDINAYALFGGVSVKRVADSLTAATPVAR